MMLKCNLLVMLSLFTIGMGVTMDAHAQSAFGDPSDQVAESGGGLKAVETDISAGTIPVGSTAQVITRFKNEGSRPIEFQDIKLYPSSTVSAVVNANECVTEPLNSGAECAIIISVQGLQPGNWRTEMLIRHTGQSRLVTARINGIVESGEDAVKISTDIDVSPNPVMFGTLTASRPIIRSLTIRNITAQPITLNEMFIDAPDQSGYDLKTDCTTLTSGQACIASILWSPIIEGPSSGFLVIQHDGASAVTNIPLTGEFTPGEAQQARIFPNSQPGRGVLVSSETEIDFGSSISAQSAITVSLVNTGDADLTIKDIQLAGSENGLKLLNDGCQGDAVLNPTEACPLTISWSPTKRGSVIDDVRIAHDGARGILVLPIRGSATEAISMDSKPIIVSNGESYSTTTPSSTSGGSDSNSAANSNQGGVPVLDGYVVTSHSSRHAIIKGPVGSRIVAHNKTALVGGFVWDVKIVPEGVRLSNGNNIILLVFDRSLSNSGDESSTVLTGAGS